MIKIVKSAIWASWAALGLLAASANAGVIRFDNYAPAANAGYAQFHTYTETGFVLTNRFQADALISRDGELGLVGDPTGAVTFASSTTLTLTGAAPFVLNSIDLGASSLGGNPASITLTGNIAGGGTITQSFTGLTNATTGTVNWVNLVGLEVTTGDPNEYTFAALDNIVVNEGSNPPPVVLAFEDNASTFRTGNVKGVTENGFTLTSPLTAGLQVHPGALLGDSTRAVYMYTGPQDVITLTGGGLFTLNSIDLGPTSLILPGTPSSITLTGHLPGGGIVTQTFNGLTSATTATLNWANLLNVTIANNDFWPSAFDNIVVTSNPTAAPEPGTILLFGTGLGGLALVRWRWNTQNPDKGHTPVPQT